MKRKEIETAQSRHDSVTIFQFTGRHYFEWCRLMTVEDHNDEERFPSAKRYSSPKHNSIRVVAVEPIDANGKPVSEYDTRKVAAFRDMRISYDLNCIRWERVSITQLSACVNLTQSFADYVTADYKLRRDTAAKRRQEEDRRQERANRNKQLATEVSHRIKQLLGEAPSYFYCDSDGEVSIKVSMLAELVTLAEKASA